MEQATGMYAKVIDGVIDHVGGLPGPGWRLVTNPVTGELERCSVSGIHLLPADELLTVCAAPPAEPTLTPWFPVVADEPAFDPATERLSTPTYTVRESDVLATYTVEPKPPEETP